MIKNIYSSNFNFVKAKQSKKSLKKNQTTPFCDNTPAGSSAKYSLNNIKAYYNPISFKGEEPQKAPVAFINLQEFLKEQGEGTDYIRSKIRISNLKPEEMIKGSYYKCLLDDAATVLTSGENLLLEVEEGAEPEIFIHSFSKKIMEGKYNGLTGYNNGLEIIKVDNPLEFLRETNLKSPESIASLTQKIKEAQAKIDPKNPPQEDIIVKDELKNTKDIFVSYREAFKNPKSKKILFINNFEQMRDNYPDIGELLKMVMPDISIVGFVKKPTENNSEQAKKNEMIQVLTGKKAPTQEPKVLESGMPTLTLNGLNTAEAKEFLKKNPDYFDNAVLYKFSRQAIFTIPPKTIDTLVDYAAESSKSAFPQAAVEPLQYIIASVTNESKARILKGNWFPITPKHVERFYSKHETIAKQFAAERDFDIINNSTTRFSDLAGLETAKEEIEDTMEFLKNPKEFLAKGRKIPGGLLFVGPPGTGKSEMIMAIAGEIKAKTGKTIPVIYLTKTGNQYINSGANAIREVYEKARAHCRKLGVNAGIIVIEEADKVCRKIDTSASGQEDGKTTDELKIQMDSVSTKSSDVKIITIGTSNHSEVFDEALLRPSRFRQIHFEIPSTVKDVISILNVHSKRKPFESEASKMALFREIAPAIKGLNGDQMTQILDEATKLALKSKKKIGLQELTEGLFKTLYGPRVNHDYDKKDRLVTTMHELGHAINCPEKQKVVAILNESRDVPGIGIANALCYFTDEVDTRINFFNFLDTIAKSYGGGDAELLLNPSHGAGVANDYSKITENISAAIKEWNLGVHTPPMSFVTQSQKEFEEYSKMYEKEIKRDIELFTETAHRISKQRIAFHKDFALNTYLKEQVAHINAGEPGKSYLGHEYNAMVNAWLQESGMIKAKSVLEHGVTAIKTVAFNEKFWTQKAKIENARNILSDGIESLIDLSQQKSWLDNATTSAESLTAKIQEIVHLAENGNKWLSKAGAKNAEQKLIKAVERIVTSASSDKLATSRFKQAASLLFSFV